MAKITYTNKDASSNDPAIGYVRDVDLNEIKTVVNGQDDAILALQSGKQNVLGYTPENASNKGQNNGYASLGSDGQVPATQSRPATLSMNSSTFVLTFTDPKGTVTNIDLPIETLFQNASYNSSTKTLTLTMQNGTTVDVPLSDLVDLPEVQVSASSNPGVAPSTGQRLYFRADNGSYWISSAGSWAGPFLGVTQEEKDQWNSSSVDADVVELAYTQSSMLLTLTI